MAEEAASPERGGAGPPASPAAPSPLATFGREVVAVAGPVSACMLLTVLLVRILIPDGASEEAQATVRIATFYYHERATDSAGTKFAGGLVNALIFAGTVGAMTVVLFLLFKYRCTKVIYGYFAVAGFSIYFSMTGALALSLIEHFGVAVDYVTFTFVLYNFAIVGVLAVFFAPAPITMKQGYLVVTGTVTAFVFTFIPAWTTWILLGMMAVYDIIVVLAPGGPLKALVELADERDEPIPALVYETRPEAPRADGIHQLAAGPPPRRARAAAAAEAAELGEGRARTGGGGRASEAGGSAATDLEGADVEADLEADLEDAPLIAGPREVRLRERGEGRAGAGGDAEAGDEEDFLPDSLKLGLGDFIFYSIMVGRASMYDMMTAFSCYVAILAGLGGTLAALAIVRKALPALPFSIALGIAFYFLTRLCLEPFAVPLSTQLLYF